MKNFLKIAAAGVLLSSIGGDRIRENGPEDRVAHVRKNAERVKGTVKKVLSAVVLPVTNAREVRLHDGHGVIVEVTLDESTFGKALPQKIDLHIILDNKMKEAAITGVEGFHGGPGKRCPMLQGPVLSEKRPFALVNGLEPGISYVFEVTLRLKPGTSAADARKHITANKTAISVMATARPEWFGKEEKK